MLFKCILKCSIESKLLEVNLGCLGKTFAKFKVTHSFSVAVATFGGKQDRLRRSSRLLSEVVVGILLTILLIYLYNIIYSNNMNKNSNNNLKLGPRFAEVWTLYLFKYGEIPR